MNRAAQADLFGDGVLDLPQPIPVAPGRFALAGKVATAMARAIDTSAIARPDIAARMTALTGKRVSLAVLNAMTAMSRPDHVPNLLQAMAFDATTGLWSLLQLYAEAAGGKIIFGDDLVALELGRVAQAREALHRRDVYLKKVAGARR